MIENDRQIVISTAGSRKATEWPQQILYWSEFVKKLATPARGTETMAEYLSYPKNKQDALKDVGGFVAGILEGNKRRAGSVRGRDILTLDLDNIQPGGTNDALLRVDGLGCAYAVYSTRKHEESKPRLRVLIPLNRTATADEYEPLARKTASMIGIELCDPTTFEASRLMYLPSCCRDSRYVYKYGDKPFLDADGILAKYNDWHNVSEWPQVPGAKQSHRKLAERQEDPTSKIGIIGAFCKTYDVYKVMETFIPGIYEPCDNSSDRYSYTGRSTVGGAIIYENGNFLYSHHATDPAGGKLCNSFDLVRLHKFNEMDDEAKADTPVNKLPSYKAMCEFAVNDTYVATFLNKERYEKVTRDFGTPIEDNANWISKLQLSTATGAPAKTTDNILIILENDPLLKGKITFDEFASRRVALGALPWDKTEGQRIWKDNDDAGTQWYLEHTYNITGDKKIINALSLCENNHKFDNVKKYLTGLSWDGIKRLDSLFIDYLGAADNIYTRAITRKAFTAAVARVMTPGVKFDNMVILTGAQGHYKSTLLKKMGRGWFSDSIKTFEGKEASELVQGVWLVEISELEAFNRSEIGRIKQFLSQCEDIFRAAYGRHVGWHLRRCVFFGTSNNGEYLRDKTGNRRFWPIDIAITKPTKGVWGDLDDEVDQIWAEAFMRWQLGEPLYLPKEIEKLAEEEQESHREHSAREGIIREFVEKKVPADWTKWPLDRRRMFWANGITGDIVTVERDRICALEVWVEALNGDIKYMKYSDAAEINGVVAMLDGWKKQKKSARFGYCGVQKGFKRG
ncbi:VapE domain-containing protein [Clostridium sp. WILCCON 0269]|uniref:VapE domain-containing protein n=1 Tax=Candidatus Clostridium eludens TaxID=3381663 RepID=A0ABW8SMT7_9CLOT